MIISEQWLRDWVGVDLDAQGIADCLTLAGLEVDGVQPLSTPLDNVIVGQVDSVKEHPDADRLNLTKVNIGDQLLDIVCGASNVREGLLVAVATIGAKLPNGLKIKKAKVRGVESFGMLCSAAELGLEDSSDGLLELNDDAVLGQRVDDYLQLNDNLIDIDLTPNRGDCLSVQGVARELRVLANADYHPLDENNINVTSDQTIEVTVEDATACPRYLARVISGINAQATTPLWMTEKLRRSGVRPISPIVDITNYVMLELGQPMHAFDRAKLTGQIVVRESKQGEKISLLDESEQTLDDETLVICDASGPAAIAGVMGGASSAISDTSTDIVLEAAHFTRSTIAGRARRYGLHTDSSHRFERGVDPQLPLLAMQRASELIVAICGGEVGAINDQSKSDVLSHKPSVELRFKRLQSLLGMPLLEDDVDGILRRVAEHVERIDDGWRVIAPSYRFDIERECDLIEEVARVKGYHNIPTSMPRIMPTSMVASEQQIDIRQLKNLLAARDFFEVINYSFIDPKVLALFDQSSPIALSNPLAENMSVMRTSLLPGLMQTLQFNQNRQRQRIRLFEVGAVYTQTESGYTEQQKIAGVITGGVLPVQWDADNTQNVDFYNMKSDVEALLSLTGCKEPFIFNKLEHFALHPGQTASVQKNGQDLGWVGRLHPNIEKHYGAQSNVYAFELNLTQVLQAGLPQFSGVSRFPSVKRDLSIVVDDDILVSNLIQAVKNELGEALSEVVLFDVYRGDGIADNQKSISLSLSLQHQDRTLIDDEAEKIVGDVLKLLQDNFGAQLRS